MLDVHVIVSADTQSDWVEDCLSSIRTAQKNAGFPVEFHTVEGVPGHIGKARAKGYSLGINPYVTFVDDDDYILPNAFAQMKERLLEGGFDALATPEFILRNGEQFEGKSRHHLIAYRRDRVIDHTGWICCGDVAQMASISATHWQELPEAQYVHRVYLSRARLMRREYPEELVKAFGHG